MDIQNVDINSVKGYYRNAKKHDIIDRKLNTLENERQKNYVKPYQDK